MSEPRPVAKFAKGGSLLELNGEADHVHLLIALPPNLDLSNFVNNLKTTRSRLLRKEFTASPYSGPGPPASSRVGGAPLSILKQYIEQQHNPD